MGGKKTKKASTVARDKRGRKTHDEERAAGLRAPVSVRFTPEEKATLQSGAQMRGMSVSEYVRARACGHTANDDRVAEYTRKLYYGMRETGAEMMKEVRADREAQEEFARAAHVVGVAIDRVGVNINQIARTQNIMEKKLVDFDPANADAWHAEFEAWREIYARCCEALEALAENAHIDDVRPIPPLMTNIAPASTTSGTTAPASAAAAAQAAEPDVSATAGAAVAEHPESVTETMVKTKTGKQPESKSKTEPESKVKSEQKPKAKSKSESKVKSEQKTKRETVGKKKPKPVAETIVEPNAKPAPVGVVDAAGTAAEALREPVSESVGGTGSARAPRDSEHLHHTNLEDVAPNVAANPADDMKARLQAELEEKRQALAEMYHRHAAEKEQYQAEVDARYEKLKRGE